MSNFDAYYVIEASYNACRYVMYRYGQPESEIEKYVEKISSLDDRYDFFVDMKQWRKAAEIAAKMKDDQRLVEVL